MIATALPHLAERDLWRAYSAALRPSAPLAPSAFAEKYRRLHAIYCSERPGPWNNDVFPYQAPIMDAGEEAIRGGRRGLVMMKSGQGGGTDCMINLVCWLKEFFPGPQLFMTSTEAVASEFGRERFANIIADMEPLRRKYIPKKRGDILVKRFIDGKLALCGGQSVFKLQSTPYRIVCIDELDSLNENLGGQGDPVKMAEVRLDSFGGQTLMIAYAHPSTRDRGAAKLFYEQSDQRRGFVACPHCSGEFWLQWAHVKATPAHGNMTQAQAERDPDCHAYWCPKCACEISDAQRVAMVRKVVYRSVLPPDEAAKKTWIGVHFSQLYMPQKSIRFLAQCWIECADDEAAKMVFYNKRLGEPFEKTIKDLNVEDLRRLIVVPRFENDPDVYRKGTVPPGVRFLTAGQDSRGEEFHYCVWGFGLARTTAGATVLRSWLIDWDTVKRVEKSNVVTADELAVFDQLIYDRFYPHSTSNLHSEVRECAHDTGWNPAAVYEFSRKWEWRAIPIKGGAFSSMSSAPPWRESHKPKYKLNGEEIELGQPLIVFNTFLLKFVWYSTLGKQIEIYDYREGRDRAPTGKRMANLVTLPVDVDEDWLAQSSSEKLTYGKRKGEKIWVHQGPNHYADCNIYARGLAEKINPFQQGLSFEEAEERERAEQAAEAAVLEKRRNAAARSSAIVTKY